jgi:hypothetical protein
VISESDRSRIEASRQARYEPEDEDEAEDDFDKKLARWEADRHDRATGDKQ